MNQPDRNRDETRPDPALRQWIAAAVLIVLLLGCLGLFASYLRSGNEISGQRTSYRLVSSVTQSPFCPPEDPRLSSLLLERKRWIVCLIGDSTAPGRARPSMRKLIDLELWKE